MAKYSFPFDSEIVDGIPDRAYQAEVWAKYFSSFISNGVFYSPATSLQVLSRPEQDMYVNVSAGMGFINGRFFYESDVTLVGIEAADTVLNRIDAVVLRCDYIQRTMAIEVIKGTPATNPTMPSLTRNEDKYDLLLATVSVPFAAINIQQSGITDYRLNSDYCGIVATLVDQVSTTSIFNQYFAKWQEVLNTMNSNETTYNTWYAGWIAGANAQLQAQQTQFNTTKTTIENWYTDIQSDIFNAQYFDFDNWTYRAGQTRTTTFSTDGTTCTEILKNASNTEIARNTAIFSSDNTITQRLQVYADNIDVTMTTVYSSDGLTCAQTIVNTPTE